MLRDVVGFSEGGRRKDTAYLLFSFSGQVSGQKTGKVIIAKTQNNGFVIGGGKAGAGGGIQAEQGKCSVCKICTGGKISDSNIFGLRRLYQKLISLLCFVCYIRQKKCADPVAVPAHLHKLGKTVDMILVRMCGDHIIDIADSAGFEKRKDSVLPYLVFAGTSAVHKNVLPGWRMKIDPVSLPDVKNHNLKRA